MKLGFKNLESKVFELIIYSINTGEVVDCENLIIKHGWTLAEYNENKNATSDKSK
jgi:hypothetical protein